MKVYCANVKVFNSNRKISKYNHGGEILNMCNWKQNFDSKINKLQLIHNCIDSYAEKAIELIDIDESKINHNDIKNYVCGEGISTEKYKLLRERIIQKKFKISTKVLTKDEVLQEFKIRLIELLFRNNFKLLSTEDNLVENVMEQILTFNTKEAKFKYNEENNFIDNNERWYVHAKTSITFDNEIGKSGIDFQNIISVSKPEFMMDMSEEDIELENYVDGLHFDTVDSKDTKCIEMNFLYGKDKEIDWYFLRSNSYIKCLVKYCKTVYLWEDFIAESWILYKSEKYKLAFLQFFVGFDAFIENTILLLKKLISYKLFDFTNSNTSNLKLLIEHMYVGGENKGDDLSYLLVKYKRLCNDSRNLINEKFVDIIELNNYIHTSIKRDMFDKSSKYWVIKEKLNALTDIRNDLAHGSSSLESEDFQMHYLALLSIIFEIIIDFKGLKFDDLVD